MVRRRAAGSRLHGIAAAVALLLLLPMCAGGRPEAAPAAAPATDVTPPPGTAPAPSYATPPDMPASTAQGQLAPAPGSPDAMRETQRAFARAELDRAILELQASANDCAQACRALASMERATAHLCALADHDDDQRRCDDATRRLREARDHVRTSCGTCPGGPSVDPAAPVPASP